MIRENGTEGKLQADQEPASKPMALLYCTDLMFGVQLQNMARKTGYAFTNVRPGSPMPHADVLIVDLGARGDWEVAIREVSSRGVPVIAFGPHMDAEGRRKAKGAGATRALANSNLARDLPRLLLELRERSLTPADEPGEHDA
ncbi:MAG: hypothetical protein QOH93_686 [Chloroflexia bacterium]|jgi:hypothetical protein|nr:hypothetical protein [Chloroflexia bacterium]